MKRLITGLACCILLSMLAPFSFSAESTSFEPRPRTEHRATPGPFVQPETPPRWEPGPLTAAQSCEQLESWVVDAIAQRLLLSRYREGRHRSTGGPVDCTGSDSPPYNVMCSGGYNERPKLNSEKPGVETLDILKRSGNFIYAAYDSGVAVLSYQSDGNLTILSRIEPVDLPYGLLQWQDRLVILSPGTRIEIYDVSSPASPTRLLSVDLEGLLVDARLIDGRLFVIAEDEDIYISRLAYDMVHNDDLGWPELPEDASDDEFKSIVEAARQMLTPLIQQLVGDLGVTSYLPQAEVQRGESSEEHTENLMTCSDVFIPAGYPAFGIQSVFQFDITNPDIENAVLSATGIFGAPWMHDFDAGSLVLARSDEQWWKWGIIPPPSTEVHRFALSTDQQPYVQFSASGVLNSLAFRPLVVCAGLSIYSYYAPLKWNEFNTLDVSGDYIRIATSNFYVENQSHNHPLTTTEETTAEISFLWDNGRGGLARIGHLDANTEGKHAILVQLTGDHAFFVGNNGNDVIVSAADISDPVQPRILSDMILPMDLPYLRVMDGGVFLTVTGDGSESDPRDQELEARVFDLSNGTNPQPIYRQSIPNTTSMWDFQAYTYQNGILTVPSHRDTGGSVFRNSLSVLEIDHEGSILPLGTVDHLGIDSSSGCPGGPAIRRSIVIGDNLFSMSYYSAKLSPVAQPEVTLSSVSFNETPVAQADQEPYVPTSEINPSAESPEPPPQALDRSESASEKQRQRKQ